MPRRSPGEGSISRGKDGRWVARLQMQGVRSAVYGRTRREVVAKLAELKRQAIGGLPDPGRRTVVDLIAEWLAVMSKDWAPKTRHETDAICKTRILPALGAVKLAALDAVHIERLLSGIKDEGHQRLAQLTYAILHRACVQGVKWRWLADNPCTRVDRPQHKAAAKVMWTEMQLRVFLDGARPHWLYPLWHTIIASGCRLGEMLALTWADVDLDTSTIKITKSARRLEGEVIVSVPKTVSGNRTIALPAEAVAILRLELGRQLLSGMARGPVFPNRHGRILHHRTVEAALLRECQRLGLPPLCPHDLRHLHASLLLADRVPLPAVSVRLGHADPGITAKIYSHEIKARDDPGVESIGRVLRK
jgi:integrase